MREYGTITYVGENHENIKANFSELIIPNFDNKDQKSFLENLRIGIVIADWNREITDSLLEGTVLGLIAYGVKEKNISVMHVPGSFELLYGAKLLRENMKPDVIICIGCLIEGETEHFNVISNAVSSGIRDLNLQSDTPVVFGVLTTKTPKQAKDRIRGGKHGNSGIDFADTAISMGYLRKEAASK